MVVGDQIAANSTRGVTTKRSPVLNLVSYYHHGIYAGNRQIIALEDEKHIVQTNLTVFAEGGDLYVVNWKGLPIMGEHKSNEEAMITARYYLHNGHLWPKWSIRRNCEAFAGNYCLLNL